MRLLFLYPILLIMMLASSCDEEESIGCTEEFRLIGISVVGENLTEFYTIRVATGDTLYLQDFYVNGQIWYPILEDHYQPEFNGSPKTFRFVGVINSTIVVNETYVITADECHISKVSGVEQVVL